MPGGFPAGLEFCNGTAVGTVSSHGTTVTASATTNTKGAYAQLSASTAADATWMVVYINNQTGSGNAQAVDIAIGASGSEQIIAANLLVLSLNYSVAVYGFPVQIPAGTRIAARVQSTAASDGIWVGVQLFDGAFMQIEGVAGLDSIGFTAASTDGTAVTPSATANTMGSYAQLIASTSRDYMGVYVALDVQNGAPATQVRLLDIAIGAAGSEQVIIPNIQIILSAGQSTPNVIGPFFIPIPSGTRVAARCQSSAASGVAMGCTVYGMYQ